LQIFIFYSCPACIEYSVGCAEISEDEAEDRLQDAIQEKFAVFGDVCTL